MAFPFNFGGKTVGEQVRIGLEALTPESVNQSHGAGDQQFNWRGSNAIRVANELFGANNWISEVADMQVIKEEGKFTVTATCMVKITVKWADGTENSHQDFGCGCGNGPSYAHAIEGAGNGAVRNGLERALQQFGDGLENCLYDKRCRDCMVRNAPQTPQGDTCYDNQVLHCSQRNEDKCRKQMVSGEGMATNLETNRSNEDYYMANSQWNTARDEETRAAKAAHTILPLGKYSSSGDLSQDPMVLDV